jgi:formylglycine-generating enzyme required for sulfatase activity
LVTHDGFRVVVALKSPVVQAQVGKDQNSPKNPAAPAMATNKSPFKAPATTGPGDPKVRVPAGCRAAAGTQAEPYTKSGWAQVIVHEATGMEMAYIPAGSFLMGMNPEDKAYPYLRAYVGGWEAVQHRVTLTKGFYMGKTEVTQALWEKVMGSNPAHFKNAGPEAPVESVSWEDCQNFCQKAGGGLRLPSEAEWEYACRAGTEGLYAGDPEEMGWYLSNSDGAPQAVGTKNPNAWGLHDMHGNVWEFCQDFFGPYDSSGDAVTDPSGPTKAGSPPARVIRGGGWGDYGAYCISAIRGHFSTEKNPGNPAVGCRFVLPAAGAP